ncbi:MAG TPA: tRNA (N6-isopentenyl adenosine(37)-C2)-methylthiotransferase MiaB [Pyrinomonadaceae bacterium]|nr:tRNA (N6-isopentenyl adenosine(37)-C2)-methylthiotransferase MiaB [Chloracidobacterium sp.]HQX57025.1 tRNA (N6-isopentenyl adenosine(37)-C2)-methylthiotransferase MiaB [Pyrinomonadaceae bacterium]HQY67889.1 tRNA (N6-isopentenyl adenosine(37)-C2)-methylthiotransferase MiaB [Pyrinomonadaceae bacterium]HRA40575.1 tRNA (N6-isopentenyl adenosine(37)-C2)-methylthiotransferase MiaB [Pyrinomonadaceae bacterium]
MKKVYLETYGCQMNVSDSERISTTLAGRGYEMTNDEAQADVVILNTCSVREKAEQKLYSRVGRIRHADRPKPIVGVMGCVAQLEGETLFSKIEGLDFVVGTQAVGRVADAIARTLSTDEAVVDLGSREVNYDWTVAENQRHSPYIAFLPIIEGCNKFCTYCIVPFARGRERSRSASEIVRQVLELRRNGVREVHLIGQNVNSYKPESESGLEQFEGKSAFSRLLRAVAATGIERVKFATSFPRDFNDDIVDVIESHDNVCNWVHLPVQSGSSRILAAMKRGHTIEKYLKKIDRIKSSTKDISLTTDIIVGFPGETEDDFQATIKMVEYCGFDSAYIFKYSPRPGTPAFEMADDVSPEEKTRRFIELENTQKRIQSNNLQRYLNKVLKVLVERPSTRTDGGLTGHSTCQKLVNFVGTTDMIGEIVDVRVTQIKTNSLFGVPV